MASCFSDKLRIRFFAITVLTALSLSGIAQKIELTGKVIDYDTKLPIAGASVKISSINKFAVSDGQGMFKLLLEIDTYELTVTVVGYKMHTQLVYLLDTNYVLIELKKKLPTELPEVIVESRKKDANVSEAKMSTINVNIAQLKKTPLVFGEADIIKALLLQTGITSIGEGAGGFSVRGGNADQNLMLLDGAPLFNTSHLLGFYSTISPEAIQDFTLYKGAIPASYGGRLSSMAYMNVRPGNEEKIHYGTSISPVSVHLFAEGPVIRNSKLTFSADARIAYPKFLMNQFPGSVSSSNAFFYDVTGKLVYKFNPKNQISVTLYRSYDNFKFTGDTSYSWETDIMAINGRSEILKKLTLLYNANISYYSSDINGLQPGYEFRLRNTIQNTEGKAGLHFQSSDKVYFEGGFDFIRYTINPGTVQPTSSSSQINPMHLRDEYGNEMAGYLLAHFDFTKFISLEAGMRYSYFAYKGPQTIYQYQEGLPPSKETVTDSIQYPNGKTIQNYQGLEPRILVKIGLDEQTSIKLSYNKTRQYLQLISNTIAITPVDYWKLSDPLLPPALADQYAAGVFRNFNNDNFETSIEGFYKITDNLIDYRNGAQLSMNPYLDADLLSAKGKAYGVEFNVRKTKGKYTGQLAYTWSRSLIADITSFSAEQVNGGVYYPSNYDRPFNLSLTGAVKMGQGWTFGCTFVYITGRPATYPDGTYVINNTIVTNYSQRNMDRLPDYNRLDISFSHDSRRTVDQKRYTVINFSLYNVYARKNPYSIYFQRSGGTLQAYELSVLGTIIPSMTLSFYF
ncbi:MAG TPA: carboxypeptidase-like regulatory domain-containing protein [Puia sp.]|nr:carboxypeptidase-like regulatory domain-containing protein [Puia sp.]